MLELEEIRHRIEVQCPSPFYVGSIIHDVLQCDRELSDYKVILEIVRDKLMDFQTETEKLQCEIDRCKTIKDLGYFISTTNFAKYNNKGIPISSMITKRMREIYDAEEKNNSFSEKLKRFFGIGK